ncbi:hypothetical protein ON010_g12288 [Phytophthora cinnamomi]|nr:hypothetical protein ON010_g12288 [Phytophthora cinnamomi]
MPNAQWSNLVARQKRLVATATVAEDQYHNHANYDSGKRDESEHNAEDGRFALVRGSRGLGVDLAPAVEALGGGHLVEPLGRRTRNTGQVRGLGLVEVGGTGLLREVDVVHAEPRAVRAPLVVVQERPGGVADDGDLLLDDGLVHLLHEGLEVPELIHVLDLVVAAPSVLRQQDVHRRVLRVQVADHVEVSRRVTREHLAVVVSEAVRDAGARARHEVGVVHTLVRRVPRQQRRARRVGLVRVAVRNGARGVVVHHEDVVRAFQQSGLLRRELGETVAGTLAHDSGVVAVDDGVQEPTEVKVERALGSSNIARVILVERIVPVGDQDDADAGLVADHVGRLELSELVHGLGVGQQHVAGDRVGLRVRPGVARGVHAEAVAGAHEGQRLVERGPELHLAAELVEQQRRVLEEVVHDLRVEPALGLELRLQLAGQVPVVDGEDGGDAVGVDLVDEVVVPGDALGVGPHAARDGVPVHGARPRDGEAEGLEPRVHHELDVVLVAVVEVVGHVGALHAGLLATKVVPDARRAAALLGGALHLVRGGGRAEHEALGEAARLGGRRHGPEEGRRGQGQQLAEEAHRLAACGRIRLRCARAGKRRNGLASSDGDGGKIARHWSAVHAVLMRLKLESKFIHSKTMTSAVFDWPGG